MGEGDDVVGAVAVLEGMEVLLGDGDVVNVVEGAILTKEHRDTVCLLLWCDPVNFWKG